MECVQKGINSCVCDVENKVEKNLIRELFHDAFGLERVEAGPLLGPLGLSQLHQLVPAVAQPDFVFVLVNPAELLNVLLRVKALLSFWSQALGTTRFVGRLVDRHQKHLQLRQQLAHFSFI
jgi:hypothetical protein